MKWRSLLLILVFSWLIGGCQSLATPRPIVPAFTATLQGTKPTQPPMTATFTPRPTTTVTPTEAPDIAATVISISSPGIRSSLLSPDGKWQAEVVIHDCVKVDPRENADANAIEMLKLIRISDQTEMIIESDLLNCGGVGAYGIGGLYWSPSSQYFYYTDARESAPDGLCGYWARPIKRVNVDSQKAELVGGGHLSPDKTKLALWQDNEIILRNLDGGEIARIPASIPEAFNNEIAWSPDSQSLVYLQTELDCFPFGKSYVTRLDLSGMTQNLLFESDELGFSWLIWDAPYRISLVDDKGNKWRYNLISKELNPAP